MRATEPPGPALSTTEAISEEMVALYGRVYGAGRTTARTFISENVVVCVLEDVLTARELHLVEDGARREVMEARVSFQDAMEDEFSAAVERLTGRKVIGFLSGNQTSPSSACELFFLAPDPEAAP